LALSLRTQKAVASPSEAALSAASVAG
jgi:hypothetical protein